jgi:Flp pilus assembly pilin Flp
MQIIKQLCNDEQGATMAEYALLLALIAVTAIGVLQILGGQISGVFERAGDAIDEALPASSSS